MQTSLNWPEIIQIHHFMEHIKGNCFNLKFILPKIAKEAKNILKTIIFDNNISDICPIITIITKWM